MRARAGNVHDMMAPSDTRYDVIIRHGALADMQGLTETDIGIRNGRIAALGVGPQASAEHVIDASGLTLLPGVIDSQVHFREPGLTHKEDFETGSLAAVMGGVTAVFEMPNTDPPTTTHAALEAKIHAAHHRMHCDFAFYVGACADNVSSLRSLQAMPGVCGVKVFMGSSTGSLLVPDDALLAQVLAQLTRRAAFHSEDEARLNARRAHQMAGKPASHAIWRDVKTALLSTQRLLALARQHARAVHVLHVTTADEIALLGAHKDIASVEVTPQHLTLFAPEVYERLGTLAQMNPPIRDKVHYDALWQGVRDGVVDVIGSDHAPHSLEEKQTPYPDSPSGMPGVQTLLPLLLTHVADGRLPLSRVVALTSANIARLFGLVQKGAVAPGYDADITFVDLQARYEITSDWLKSRCGWSPFEGYQCTGRVVGTMLRGQTVMWERALLTPHLGEMMRFANSGGQT